MHGDRPSPKSLTFPMRTLAFGRELWRAISNPLAVGLLGLALAVTLWGYGYKLSLYGSVCGNSTPRVPVAKLWIEHRFGVAAFSQDSNSPKLKPRVYAQPGASAVFAVASVLPFQHGPALPPVSVRAYVTPFFHAAIPLRSPPLPTSL